MSEMEAQAAPAVSPVVQPAPSKFKVPVDGEELEVDIEELKRGYSHGRAANKRMAEAAEIRKAEAARRDRAAKGDFSWLNDYGVPKQQVLKWAEKELLDLMEFDQLPDAEKKRISAERERDEYRKQIEELTAKEQRQLQETVTQKAFEEIDTQIADALQSYKGKKTPRLVRRVAEAMYANLEKNQAPLASSKALEIAQKSLHEDLGEYLNIASVPDLIKMLSKEQISAIRKHFVQEAQAQSPFARQPSARSTERETPSRARKKMTTDDYFKKIENRLGR